MLSALVSISNLSCCRSIALTRSHRYYLLWDSTPHCDCPLQRTVRHTVFLAATAWSCSQTSIPRIFSSPSSPRRQLYHNILSPLRALIRPIPNYGCRPLCKELRTVPKLYLHLTFWLNRPMLSCLNVQCALFSFRDNINSPFFSVEDVYRNIRDGPNAHNKKITKTCDLFKKNKMSNSPRDKTYVHSIPSPRLLSFASLILPSYFTHATPRAALSDARHRAHINLRSRFRASSSPVHDAVLSLSFILGSPPHVEHKNTSNCLICALSLSASDLLHSVSTNLRPMLNETYLSPMQCL